MRFADEFYVSAAWRKCRADYAKSKGGLCERCAALGLIVVGEQVHHKVRLTPQNIYDERISLNWDNLELLCAECHEREHGKHKRWADSSGHVEI